MQQDKNENILTHQSNNNVDLEDVVANMKKRIIENGDKDDFSVEERLDILKQLPEFELGRSLLINRGFTGYWTRYVNLYPKRKHEYNVTHPLEKFILEKSTGILATQQRFDVNQGLLQKYIQNGMTLCSLPCGFMDDLLTLNLSKTPNVRFVGIDIDEESVNGAKKNAKDLNLDSVCTFHVMDAWKMEFKNEFDILTSNMLVQYVTDEEAIIKFYQLLFDSLKDNGILLITCMLPVSAVDWSKKKYDLKDVKKSAILFYDILQAKWTNYQPVEKMTKQLIHVGFKSVEAHYEEIGRFPTLVARK